MLFRRALLREAGSRPWRRIDIVAHSFGTHIAAWALRRIPKSRPRVHTIILAGSVLRPRFNWTWFLESGDGRVVNDCGVRDWVLGLSQLLSLGTGHAGLVGFQGLLGPRLMNRYFDHGHSGYFLDRGGKPSDGFMRRYWLDLLLTDAEPEPVDERPELTVARGVLLVILNNAEYPKIIAYALLLWSPIHWCREALAPAT